MAVLALGVLVSAYLSSVVDGQIRILAPGNLAKEFKDTQGNIKGATAVFGTPYYGEHLIGQLQYGESQHGEEHCTDNDYSIGSHEDSDNAYKTGKMINIVLVRRGKCTFVTKARVAKKKGAHAVIVVDKEDSPFTSESLANVIVADDGYGDKIDIPLILISRQDGKRLIDAVKRPQPIIAELAWDIPMNHFVTMDLWMSSASRQTTGFLREFRENAKELGDNLHFVPHFHVFSMPADYNELCSDGTGRFCAEDPDGSGPVTGAMVLREDVRQLCILETTGELVNEQVNPKTRGYHYSWWDYVTEFNTRCPVHGLDENSRFGDACAQKVLGGIRGIDREKIERCIATRTDAMLEHERTNIAWSPHAIRINGWRYKGQLDPDLATRALCSGFVVKPKECESLLEARQNIETKEIISVGVSFGTFAAFLLLLVILLLVVLLLYRRFLSKQVHGVMREEVMLEVAKEMESYLKLPETPRQSVKLPSLMDV
eukprot:gnl/MRDRNA2_/MRDRNA2_93065_c0_seq1.p1 gnl/MRDRNA2_/MRDRNA2_93065_c0~~gnl/MRDRNA2_/MRDRNA2_93065_c0_seq1.p1  ORF type:complete len:517 (+),score=84.73 gnl/MRDRNA2_/MRDRNA2_93065_c0_seq1:94-1551(+)